VSRHLAAGARAAGDSRALGRLLAARDLVARPLPARASTRSAKNVGVGTSTSNANSVISHGKASDRNAGSGFAGGRTILVVLLNNNTVLGDAGEDVARVSDAGDLSSSTVDSLDTETVLRVGDLVVQELDVRDSVVVATSDRADGQTMATSASGARNRDVGTRVDSDTVVLDCTSVLRVSEMRSKSD
jgi:hypothetical protein